MRSRGASARKEASTRQPLGAAASRALACGPVLALCLALPASAQIIPTGSPAVDILLARALADQRVFLTCTALAAETHEAALDLWQADVTATVALLGEKAVAPDVITAFTAAADPATLALPADTPFAAVADYCRAQADWLTRWTSRDFTQLARALPGVLQ